MTTLTVGALASASGVTVRTLHHYDEIGLLSPSGRTPSGHRLYGAAEVRRLQQIASLRQVGLSLEEIAECLANPEYSLDRVLALHLDRLDELIRRQEELRGTVERLRDRVRSAGDASVDDLLETIEMTISFERYYSPEQMEWLESRRADVGEDRMRQAQADWADVFAGFTDAMERDLDPAAEEVQALVARSAALVEEFTGGNPEIADSLRRMYANEDGESLMASRGMPMAPGLWAYMERARNAATP